MAPETSRVPEGSRDRAAASAGVTRAGARQPPKRTESAWSPGASEVRGRGPEPSALAITASTTPEGMIVMYAICRPVGATVALSGSISPGRW